jgi:hypothetical protein
MPQRDEILINSFTLGQVYEEMKAAREQYSRQHDDKGGSGHLVAEAVDRLTHMGEYPIDEVVQHEIIVAIGLLFFAHDTLSRAIHSHTITIDNPEGNTPS